jgi:soluble lytic murein transglycosylase-like protein
MRKLALALLALVAAIAMTGCTPEQMSWYFNQDGDSQTAAVEAIISVKAEEYGIPPAKAVAIARCESGLNPSSVNRHSGALGLYQHLPSYWPKRAEAMGYDPALWYDPNVMADVSMAMLANGDSPWASSRSCWGGWARGS